MEFLHPNVELEVLAAIVKGLYKDRAVLDKIEPGFFSVKSQQWLISLMKSRKFEAITWEYLDSKITESFADAPDKFTLYRNQLWQIFSRDLTFQADAENTFKEFVAFSIVKSTIKGSFDNYKRSKRFNYFIDELKGGVSSAAFLVDGNSLEVSDYADSYKKRMQERIYYRDNPAMNPIIKTGFEVLDNQIEVSGPMLFNFLAPFKMYKSIFLNSVGFASLLQGYNVCHVVFENTIELTETRYDSLFSGLMYTRLKKAVISPEEKRQLDERMEWVSNWSSRLKIIKGVSKRTKIEDIENQLIRFEELEGFRPDVLVLDYINIVAPSKFSKEERHQQDTVMWDIKDFIDSRKIPCFTASQTNQEGNKVVRNVKGDNAAQRVNSTHQGKAIDISQAVDVSVSINQTDQEKLDNLIILSIVLARDAEIYQPEIVLDSDVKRMAVSRDIHHLWDIAQQVHRV
jgi:hypothetical protein